MMSIDEFWAVSLPDYGRESSRIWQTIFVAAMFLLFFVPVGCGRVGSGLRQDRPLHKGLTAFGFVFGFGCWVTITAYLAVHYNAYNYYIPRRVFSVPLLTSDECKSIVYMAHRAAQANFQNYLQSPHERQQVMAQQGKRTPELVREPIGWRKDHGPTAHLHLERDPFTAANRTWLADLLDRRLGPSLSRLYGVPDVSAIQVNDMYIVRYDADLTPALPNHTDVGDITFQILLHDDFEGGGTTFWERPTRQPFAHVEPMLGTLLVYSANLNHEEITVTDGTRVLLIGNARIEPPAEQFLASWCNVGWVLARCKYDVGALGLPQKLYPWIHDILVPILESIGDTVAPHTVETMVEVDRTSEYLQALDVAYETQGPSAPKIKWWGSIEAYKVSPYSYGKWPKSRESSHHCAFFSQLGPE